MLVDVTLLFAVKTAYWKSDKPVKSVAPRLMKLAWQFAYDSGTQQGVFWFPLTLKDEISGLLNVPLELPGSALKTRYIQTEGDLREDGPFEIVGRTLAIDRDISKENPVDCYVVRHLKYGKNGKAKLVLFTVSFERVRIVFQCINESLKIGESAESVKFHEKMCEEMDIVRFNRGDKHDGSFDDAKFKGTSYERNTFWRILRILDAEGVIRYPPHCSRLTKLKDRFDLQEDLENMELDLVDMEN